MPRGLVSPFATTRLATGSRKQNKTSWALIRLFYTEPFALFKRNTALRTAWAATKRSKEKIVQSKVKFLWCSPFSRVFWPIKIKNEGAELEGRFIIRLWREVKPVPILFWGDHTKVSNKGAGWQLCYYRKKNFDFLLFNWKKKKFDLVLFFILLHEKFFLKKTSLRTLETLTLSRVSERRDHIKVADCAALWTHKVDISKSQQS